MIRKSFNPVSVFNSLQYGFSQAVATQGGRHVYLSGQVGVDSNEKTVGQDLESQTNAAFDNIAAILKSIGGNLNDVVMLRIYLVHSVSGEQKVISQALNIKFPIDPPATSWLFVSGLSRNEWLIEIEAEAVIPD